MDAASRQHRGAQYQPCLEPAELTREFARCRPRLEAALRRSGFGTTIDEVNERLTYDSYKLWPGEDAVIVTERVGDRLNLWLAAGDYDELDAMSRAIGEHAKAQGVTHLVVFGRRGWERSFLREQGYKHRWTVLEKALWVA